MKDRRYKGIIMFTLLKPEDGSSIFEIKNFYTMKPGTLAPCLLLESHYATLTKSFKLEARQG